MRFLSPFTEVTQKPTKSKITADSYEFSFLLVYKYLRCFCFGLCLTVTHPNAEGIYKMNSSKMLLWNMLEASEQALRWGIIDIMASVPPLLKVKIEREKMIAPVHSPRSQSKHHCLLAVWAFKKNVHLVRRWGKALHELCSPSVEAASEPAAFPGPAETHAGMAYSIRPQEKADFTNKKGGVESFQSSGLLLSNEVTSCNATRHPVGKVTHAVFQNLPKLGIYLLFSQHPPG